MTIYGIMLSNKKRASKCAIRTYKVNNHVGEEDIPYYICNDSSQTNKTTNNTMSAKMMYSTMLKSYKCVPASVVSRMTR
jgi:hypothetical protein